MKYFFTFVLYTVLAGGSVLRSDGSVIPPDPANVDWQAFQQWTAKGNIPAVAPPPAAVVVAPPTSCNGVNPSTVAVVNGVVTHC